MILRSGLIKNRDGVREDVFSEHWLNVHGPLARRVPDLRAYKQNHILERLATVEPGGLHRVDGISQLTFDDVPSMARAMNSPEQQACIDDIKGFLSAVTILVMQPQPLLSAEVPATAVKLMAVLAGDLAANPEYAAAIELDARAAGVLRAVYNPVIDRSHIVDPGVASGEQVAAALAEFWFASREALHAAVRDGLLSRRARLLQTIGAFVVAEHRLL